MPEHTPALPSVKYAQERIINHIRTAPFLNPQMIKVQWGLDYKVARALHKQYYNRGRLRD